MESIRRSSREISENNSLDSIKLQSVLQEVAQLQRQLETEREETEGRVTGLKGELEEISKAKHSESERNKGERMAL